MHVAKPVGLLEGAAGRVERVGVQEHEVAARSGADRSLVVDGGGQRLAWGEGLLGMPRFALVPAAVYRGRETDFLLQEYQKLAGGVMFPLR